MLLSESFENALNSRVVRCGGLMVRPLDSGSIGFGRGHGVVFFGETLLNAHNASFN